MRETSLKTNIKGLRRVALSNEVAAQPSRGMIRHQGFVCSDIVIYRTWREAAVKGRDPRYRRSSTSEKQYNLGASQLVEGVGLGGVNLEKINLNLVPVLRALLKECSVSGAAAALGRSPSAVSETLSQLRVVLEDPLLVRVGGRLQLTPKAAKLMEPLEELHKHLLAFFRSDSFDPHTSTRSFTIASSDFVIYEIGAFMVQAMRRHAPGMSLHFVDIARGLTEKMAEREIDFALLPDFAVDDLAPAPIKFKAFKHTRSKALLNKDHPLAARSSLGREDLEGYRHIAFRPDAVLLEGRKKVPTTDVFDDSRHLDVAVTVSQFLTIPRLLEGTDLVALVPSDLADAALHHTSLVALPLTYNYFDCALGLAWSPVYDSDEAHRWFRKTVTEDSQRTDISRKTILARVAT